jgi:hypothetical protein
MSEPVLHQHGEQPYRCNYCGHAAVLRAYWIQVPEECRQYTWETERKLDPLCSSCGCSMTWYPEPTTGWDLLPEDFIVDGETIGRGEGKFRISSLSEIRVIERESERRHRNGEGQIIAFREFNQDRGNSRTNSFTGSGYETGRSQLPVRRHTIKRGLPIQVRPTS